jgi:hypothetical protein
VISILDACRDANLFKPWFRDRQSWFAWFAFLAALFALPMTEEQLAIFKQCTGRNAVPRQAATEAWLACGRRAGKSFVLALVAVYLANFRDYRQQLAPGERGTVVIIAADRRQARVIFRYVRGLLNGVPMLARLIERETADAFDLSNGVTIEIQAASFRSTRGYTLIAALCDEIAFWRSDESANPDTEILAALRPAMATIPGAMLLCASSPYARRGALWSTYRKHFGQDGSILVWQAPTSTMNPTIPQSVIDEATERDPASAAAEYGAQFRSDIESFINREAVEACIALGVLERPPVPGIKYFAWVDPSGGSADSFTLALAHRDGDTLFLDCIREVRPPFSPESVVDEFATLCKTYRITRVTGDRYAGEWPREQFRKRGIAYELSPRPKSDLYRDLLPLINSRRVDLLDHQRLIAQLVGLERRTARSGRDSIDHTPGTNDDVANASAGALLSALSAPKRLVLVGTYGYGGPITWRDPATGEEIDPKTKEPIPRTRIRVVRIIPQA